jgi:hypothetical protein
MVDEKETDIMMKRNLAPDLYESSSILQQHNVIE